MMTTREEIRKTLELWGNGGCLYRDIECENRSKDPFTHQVWCGYDNDLYTCLMKRLDSQGVVIIDKDRGLPLVISRHVIEKMCGETAYINTKTLGRAGYVATIPIIEG